MTIKEIVTKVRENEKLKMKNVKLEAACNVRIAGRVRPPGGPDSLDGAAEFSLARHCGALGDRALPPYVFSIFNFPFYICPAFAGAKKAMEDDIKDTLAFRNIIEEEGYLERAGECSAKIDGVVTWEITEETLFE